MPSALSKGQYKYLLVILWLLNKQQSDVLVLFPDNSSSNLNPVPKKKKKKYVSRLEEPYMSSSSGAVPAFLNLRFH